MRQEARIAIRRIENQRRTDDVVEVRKERIAGLVPQRVRPHAAEDRRADRYRRLPSSDEATANGFAQARQRKHADREPDRQRRHRQLQTNCDAAGRIPPRVTPQLAARRLRRRARISSNASNTNSSSSCRCSSCRPESTPCRRWCQRPRARARANRRATPTARRSAPRASRYSSSRLRPCTQPTGETDSPRGRICAATNTGTSANGL